MSIGSIFSLLISICLFRSFILEVIESFNSFRAHLFEVFIDFLGSDLEKSIVWESLSSVRYIYSFFTSKAETWLEIDLLIDISNLLEGLCIDLLEEYNQESNYPFEIEGRVHLGSQLI